MINIYLHFLIDIIPELVNLFLSGFIFMSMYTWITNKKIDISSITIWSLFISVLIKTFYSLLHSFILLDCSFDENFKVIIYVVTGFILPFVFIRLKNSKVFRYILFNTNSKSINIDIFDDMIDYDKRTTMQVYLKNSNIMYIDTFKLREENGKDSFIALTDYASMYINTKDIIFKPDDHNLKSSVIINLQDVERIEIVYDKNSKLLDELSLSSKDIFKTQVPIKPFDIERMTGQPQLKGNSKGIELKDDIEKAMKIQQCR